jgi:hypothetical protein
MRSDKAFAVGGRVGGQEWENTHTTANVPHPLRCKGLIGAKADLLEGEEPKERACNLVSRTAFFHPSRCVKIAPCLLSSRCTPGPPDES